MNKKTALSVLGLSESASYEQAKNAYRQLAKKYHPDVIESNLARPSQSDARMKEINLAFRFLVPLLPSESEIKKRISEAGRKIKPDDLAYEKRKDRPRIFSSLRLFFTQLISDLQKKQDSVHPVDSGTNTRQSINKTNAERKKKQPRMSGKVKFDDVLTRLTGVKGKKHPAGGLTGRQNKPESGSYQDRQRQSPYRRYRQYMKLRKKYRPVVRHRSKGMRVDRVSEIDPVRPVYPVEKD